MTLEGTTTRYARCDAILVDPKTAQLMKLARGAEVQVTALDGIFVSVRDAVGNIIEVEEHGLLSVTSQGEYFGDGVSAETSRIFFENELARTTALVSQQG